MCRRCHLIRQSIKIFVVIVCVILIASNAQPINHKTDNNNVAPFTRWNDSLHEAIWKTFNSMFIWRSASSEPQKKQSKNVTRFLFYIYVKCQKHAIGHKSVQRQNQVMFGIIDVNKMQSKTLHSTESHLCDVFQMSEMFMHKFVFIELTKWCWNWMSKNQYDLRQLLRFGVFFLQNKIYTENQSKHKSCLIWSQSMIYGTSTRPFMSIYLHLHVI